MHPYHEYLLRSRRHFLTSSASGIGLLALASLLRDEGYLSAQDQADVERLVVDGLQGWPIGVDVREQEDTHEWGLSCFFSSARVYCNWKKSQHPMEKTPRARAVS